MTSLSPNRRSGRSQTSLSEMQLNEMKPDQILRVLQQTKKNIDHLRLENDLLERYLQKHNPALLMGITKTRLSVNKATTRIQFAIDSARRSDLGSVLESSRPNIGMKSETMSVSSRKTNASMSFASTRSQGDLASSKVISYVFRTEMCDMDCVQFAQEIENIRNSTKEQLRHMSATIEDNRMTNTEAIETLNEFKAFVLRDQPLAKVPFERFVMFVDMMVKNGNGLTETLRLRTATMKQQIFQMQKELAIKAELSGILRPIDFEQLQIEDVRGQRVADELFAHFIGLKNTTARVSLTLSTERNTLLNAQKTLDQINRDLDRSNAECMRFDASSRAAGQEIDTYQERLDRLLEHRAVTQVPTVDEYMERKQTLQAMSQEKKTLRRRLATVQLKLLGTKNKIRQKKASLARQHKIRQMIEQEH